MTHDQWIERLDELIELRGKGQALDELHHETCKAAARIDFTFLVMIMSGEFEAAKSWLISTDRIPEEED